MKITNFFKQFDTKILYLFTLNFILYIIALILMIENNVLINLIIILTFFVIVNKVISIYSSTKDKIMPLLFQIANILVISLSIIYIFK